MANKPGSVLIVLSDIQKELREANKSIGSADINRAIAHIKGAIHELSAENARAIKSQDPNPTTF